MRSIPRSLRDAFRALGEARSYAAWRAAADEVDRRVGADAWRAEDDSPFYDAQLLRAHLDELRSLRTSGPMVRLAARLDESLYRHLGDLSAPDLYTTAYAGTKHVVEAYLDEVERCMEHIAASDTGQVGRAEKRARFQRAADNFGRTALLLSGGATLGWYHLGVCKALHDQRLLPTVISGSSMGAMVAAGLCSRDDDELDALFADPSAVELYGLEALGPAEAIRRRAVYDPEVMLAAIRHNVGEFTFAEAHARSGRVLNIHVSPVRSRQKPRLLNHLTAPDLLIAESALASSAIPGAFPPATLMRREPGGRVVPYLPTERWIDGSMHGDLPKLRLSRLLNVNHFVVSQTNPHVLPLARVGRASGLLPFTVGLTARSARSTAATAIEVARQLSFATPAGPWLDLAHSLATQDWGGDIDVHPPFDPRMFRKLMGNATPDDLAVFIREGERAAWPHIEHIRQQTRIARTFEAILAHTP
ncbi:MAG: TAG lipase/steryl ester hydrolase/phospholipase A2/LPA acyltransferase [Myxococcota bacterium]|jgi:TAG lipase/steryl ester hydrolase/phospholipase A2/LPA acyltransferase